MQRHCCFCAPSRCPGPSPNCCHDLHSQSKLLSSPFLAPFAEVQRLELNAARRAAKFSSKPIPEVHYIGEISGASGFGEGVDVCCKWQIETGEKWEWVAGERTGQTHTAGPDSGSSFAVWSHPVDLHYTAGTLQGWPRLIVQVWKQDMHGRQESLGYGSCQLPTASGSHELSCPIWRPMGSLQQETAAFFLGSYPVLKSAAPVHATAASDRVRMVTTGTGTVHVKVDAVFRHLDLHDVEWA